MKITWMRDWFNDDPARRRRIKGIGIEFGLHCRNAYQCNYGAICKYRYSGNWLPNLYVKIRRFFEYKFHIKLPWLIDIRKTNSDLSGTSKCPFQKSRLYTCWDCNYCSLDVDGPCLHPDYKGTTKPYYDPDWGEHHRCVLFDMMNGADRYDRKNRRTFVLVEKWRW